jgi:hypothetical protein
MRDIIENVFTSWIRADVSLHLPVIAWRGLEIRVSYGIESTI